MQLFFYYAYISVFTQVMHLVMSPIIRFNELSIYMNKINIFFNISMHSFQITIIILKRVIAVYRYRYSKVVLE